MAQPDYAVWLVERLHQLCDDQETTDFTLGLGRASVRCHKVILSACSETLQAICRDGRSEAHLDTYDGSDEECSRILHDVRDFMYLGTTNLTDDNVEIMIRAADYIGLQKLFHSGEQFLLNNLNASNGQHYEVIATRCNLGCVSERCEMVKKERFPEVIRTGWFQDMSVDDAHLYLQARDNQTGCEDNVLLAVHLWMQNHPGLDEGTKADFERLYSLIRIEQCTSDKMLRIAEDPNVCIFLQSKLDRYLRQQAVPPVTCPSPSAPSPPVPPALLVVGGRRGNNDKHSGILRFDTEWTNIAASHTCGNYDFYSVATGQDSLVISGGYDIQRRQSSCVVMQFSLHSLAWSALLDLPVPRERHGSACVNNKLGIFGGQLTNLRQVDSRVDILDLSSGIWSEGRRMPHPVSHPGVAVNGTNIIVIGGDVNGTVINKTQMYKVDVNEWKVCADMPVSREYVSNSTAVVDHSVYVLAGSDFLRYDIGPDQWTTLDQKPRLTRLWSVMVLDSGQLRVIGGLDPGGIYERTIQTYDLQQQTWRVEPQGLAYPLAYHSAFMI